MRRHFDSLLKRAIPGHCLTTGPNQEQGRRVPFQNSSKGADKIIAVQPILESKDRMARWNRSDDHSAREDKEQILSSWPGQRITFR
ncbi:MAG: hypothetical protein ACE5HN_09280 [Nitrospiria bacterium]